MNQQATPHIRQATLHIFQLEMGRFWSALLIATALVISVTAQAPPGNERGRRAEMDPLARDGFSAGQFPEMVDRLQESGTLPVIIRLRLKGGGSRLDEAQDALLAEMTGYDPASVKRFRYIPYLRLRIDAGGYERLRSSALVDGIQEDNAVHPDIVTRERAVKGAPIRTDRGGAAGQALVMIGAGVDRHHPELAGRVAAESCFSTSESGHGVTSLCASEERTDCSSHPTRGMACEADTGRALLAAGRDSQADRVTLIPIQVFSRMERREGCPDGRDGCLVAYDSDVALGLEKVIELSRVQQIGAVSLNVSNLRLTENCGEGGSAIEAAIRRLREGHILTVLATERGSTGHLCTTEAVTPSQVVGFTGEAAEVAGLLAAARSLLPWAGPEVLRGVLAASGADYSRFNETIRSLAGTEIRGDSSPPGTPGMAESVANRPIAPTELLGSALTTSQLELTWKDNSDNEEGFAIRRKQLGENGWTVIKVTSRNTTSFRDTGLFPGTTYLYTVTAVNVTGESPGSNETKVELPIYNFLTYSNGVPVNSSLHANRYDHYRLSVPFGATQLLVQTYGSGNSNLYVRYGSLPTIYKFDCRSTLNTSSDRCLFSYPLAGDWFIMVYSDSNSVVSYTMSATYLTGVENNRPAAPTNLLATATSFSQISLSWEDNSSNEVGFSIRRRAGINGTPVQIATVSQNVTSYFDTGLNSDVTYYYTIVAYNLAGFSGSSNDANATPPGQLTGRPLPPGGLQATASVNGEINLSWIDVSSNEAGFSIRRRAFLNNLWQVVGTVGPNITSFTDRQVVPGTTYFYTVTAINSAGESPLSNEALATGTGGSSADNTAIPPLNVIATSASTTRTILRWTDNSTSEFGYRIRRKEGTDGLWILIAIVDQNVTTFEDNGVTPGSTYYYTITSFGLSGESATSNETAVTMPTIAFTPLENGVMLPHTVGRYRLRYYRINVPSGASELLIQTKGSGSTEMYVRNGLQPTNFYYNCRSLSDTTNNRCYFLNPPSGDWYILLTSNSLQGSIYQLTATYKMGVNLNTLTPTGR